MSLNRDSASVKHLVFGTGLTGGFLLGALLHKKADVHAVGRKNIAQNWSQGLSISDYLGHTALVPAPRFITKPSESYDIIWLTVKCTATANVIDELRPFVGPSTVIVCCQNGFGSDAPIKAAFAQNPVQTAIVGFNVAEVSPAHLSRATEGDFVIAEDLAKQFNLNFGSELLPLHLSPNMLASRWAKLQLNLANAVNALADVPVKAMLENRSYRLVIAQIMREFLNVAKAKNIDLPKVAAVPGSWMPALMSLPNWLYLRIAQSTLAIDPSARTSMWWDLKNNRATEIDYLNGAVIEAGRVNGVATTANEALVALVKAVETGQAERNWQPDEFKELILASPRKC